MMVDSTTHNCFATPARETSSVLAILPDFAGGGAERVTLTLANELIRRGRRVDISVFRQSGQLKSFLDDTVRVHDLGKTRLREVMFRFLLLVWKIKPRIVFSTLGYVNLALLLLKPLFPSGTRLWVREANLPSISLPANKYATMMRLGYSCLYPHADLVICSSKRMREELLNDFGVADSKIRVLPNPVCEQRIRESAEVQGRISWHGIRFLASGRMIVQKGFDRLLDMFAELNDPMSRLSILGEGPLAGALMLQAERLGISERVDFMGFRSDPWDYVSSADAFLLPSRWEGMPNAALEALACGVPVIATPESGGIAEVAEIAEPGAVQVAEVGRPFIEAMRRVKCRPKDKLMPSLLPPQYRLESVVDTFVSWLNQID
jgi:glycosyltransferase involved in cell wall biosynthesis